MDIKEVTTVELKAFVYDISEQIDKLQRDVKVVRAELHERSKHIDEETE